MKETIDNLKKNLGIKGDNLDIPYLLEKMQLEILSRCTEIISSSSTFEEALERVITKFCQTLSWEVGHAYTKNLFENELITSTSIWYLSESKKFDRFKAATEQIMSFRSGFGLPGDVLKTKKASWLSNIQLDKDSPRLKLCKGNLPVKGAFAFPVKDNEEIIAVLEFFSERSFSYNDLFVKCIEDLGKYLGILLGRMHVEKKLQEQKYALDKSALVSITDSEGKIIYVNELFCDLFKYTSEDLVGKDHAILSSNSMEKEQIRDLWDTIKNGGIWKGEFKNIAQDGSFCWISTTIVPLMSGGKPYQYLAVSFNITKRKRFEQQNQHLAYHDSLTGLPNHLLFKEYLQGLIEQFNQNNIDSDSYTPPKESQFGVLHIGIDDFKSVNDNFDYEVGDELISRITRRLSEYLEENQVSHHIMDERKKKTSLARGEGDNFLILLKPGISLEQIKRCSDDILKLIARPFHINNNELYISCSIGISQYPVGGENASELLRNSALALHYAKKDESSIKLYDKSIVSNSSQDMHIISGIKNALKSDDLELLYQPKFDSKTKKIIGVEALIRWNHPEKGIISPNNFISVVEKTDLIKSLGNWILDRALTDLKAWNKAGFSDISVAINLSSRQFNGELAGIIAERIKKYDVDPASIELEITERVVMAKNINTINILKDLKKLGVKISIDDFGTEYSSLNYLSDFPLDFIKIDRSFVSKMTTNKKTLAIIKSIIALAHNLNMKVIAEGVETEEELGILKQQNCNYIQGFLWGKPMPKNAIYYMLKENNL